MVSEDLESNLVLRAWKERWSEEQWLREVIEIKLRYDPIKFSNVVLELLCVGKKPNLQLLHYLDLTIASQVLPLSVFIKAVHLRGRSGSLDIINSLITTISNHVPSLRDESDAEDAAKLPTSLLALIEWLVYVQVNAIKLLSFETETQCLNLFGGCTSILQAIADDPLLAALAPLWAANRWQTLASAAQNIHIPLDACSDEGKKALASSLVSFVKQLEGIQSKPSKPPQHGTLFHLPCKQLVYHDILYHGSLCTAGYFSITARHYRCTLQKVCVEWGKAHLQVIHENKACRELVLAMLLYKFPRVLSTLFPSTKQSETVIVHLLQQDVLWATICSTPDWNIAPPFLQAALRHNLISTATFESLKEGRSSEQMSCGVVNTLQNAERTLEEVCELFNTHASNSQILSLLEGMSCSSSSFTEIFDKMFYVAAAKGELEVLVTRICNIILAQNASSTSASSTSAQDEQTRIALFDVSSLLVIRCCMMFGSHIVPQSMPFCRWLGSHVCGLYNPLQPLLPLIRPAHPPTHRDNVDMLVRFFSSDCKLDTTSLQNVITAIPDALSDIMNGFKSELIKDEVFTQQTVMLKDYMLAPVFVAIHWLIHYKDTAYEEQRTMNYLMKPFLKPHSGYTSNVLLTQRIEILQRTLNTTIFLKDKKNLIKKTFWVNCVERSTNQNSVDNTWAEVRKNATLENTAQLFVLDNIPDVVYNAAIQTLNLKLSDDFKHVVFSSAVLLQSDPRYVPWLLSNTVPDLLNEGLPSNWKSYIWALAHLTFLSVDLYLTHHSLPSCSTSEVRTVKRRCRRGDLETLDRGGLLREALKVFWRRMEEVTNEEGYSYSTTFLHRFIKLGIDTNKSRLKDILADVQPDVVKTISKHLIDHELVSDGVTLLLLSGFDQTQCSSILQSVL